MKTALKWTLALLIFAAPGWAEAITVSIKATRGATTVTVTPTVTFTDAAGKPAVALACTSNVTGAPNSTGTNAACQRTISIAGTTVTLRDVGPTNRARVYRNDALSSDILNLAGLLATSGAGIAAATGVTLTIDYSSNEFTALNYNLYAYTAAMSGNFFTAGGLKATACTATCVTLKLTANGMTVNQFGDNAIATVNVPAIDSAGGFGPPNNPNETKSIACGTSGVSLSCHPSLQGQLVAKYNGSSETLKILGGAAIGGSHRPVWAGGWTDTYVDVAAPEYLVPPLVPFVVYTQEATLQATLAQNGGRFPNLQEGSDLPLWWDLNKADEINFTPETATRLRSIFSNGNPDSFDDGAVVSFVSPQPAKVRDIKSIVADYDWVTDNCSSSFVSNSFFVELQLETLQVIRVFLGCDLSGQDLVTFTGNNVQLPNGSITSFKSIPSQYTGTNLRAISVVLAKNTANEDQEVALNSFTIGAFKTTFARSGGRSPIFAPNQLWCDFPGVNEFMMRVTPVDADGKSVGPSFIWGDAPDETFSKAENVPVPGDCQLRTTMKVNVFPPHDRESGWRFELLYNLVPVGDGLLSIARDR
jgi:hypothetical protein